MALHEDVSVLKGIGEETKYALHDIKVYTVEDLLLYFPFRYDSYETRALSEVKHEERITLKGTVYSTPQLLYFAKGKSRCTFRMLVPPFSVSVVVFNQPYLKGKIQLHEEITVVGKWDAHRQTLTANEVMFQKQENTGLQPVYHTKGKLTTKAIRKFVRIAMDAHLHEMRESLPMTMLQKYKLPTLQAAISEMHFPSGEAPLKHARRRIVFQEFLEFQLKMQLLKQKRRKEQKGTAKFFSDNQLQQFISSLPFPLTGAQHRVVREITTDMSREYGMNRLLQGDVGSGKTVVAAIALYSNHISGYQGALMVPTEILAEQHYESLSKLFEHTDVQVRLLTSSVKGKARREILEQLEVGNVHILVGTHALISEGVQFKNLGLVITDEQHRFGVEQRRVLREKGEFPDVLFMTATPIPRTLAITVFGEMEVSIINEMPAGRKEIQTYWVKHDMLPRILQFIEKELKSGRQAYVICPLIEESEKLDLQNALDVYEQLQQFYYNRFHVGLMHGKLAPKEKEEVMNAFARNDVQILVSTTVVEVGVNVPNATVMVIYDADRFGLSQLHQLRGRVGRGSEQSYCVLIADPKSDVGKERMGIMTETTDGFLLSERDLELRGPGDFFGVKQSGVPQFKVADMIHDYRALEVARQEAEQLIETNEFFMNDMYQFLREKIQKVAQLDEKQFD